MSEQRDQRSKAPSCDPREIALKSFFLGPQAENATWVIPLIQDVLTRWVHWRRSLYPADGSAISGKDQKSPEYIERQQQTERFVFELLSRFEDEVPKFSPRYIGHMFSEVSLPALIGHIVTLLHNPNNISGESSRVGTQIEDEAIRHLLTMVGFSEHNATGHFTSGGTVANFEALIRAHARFARWMAVAASLKEAGCIEGFDPMRAAHCGWNEYDAALLNATRHSISDQATKEWTAGLQNPFELGRRLEKLSGRGYLGPVILVPENLHYSWKKGSYLIGYGTEALWPIRLDAKGRLSVNHLRELIDRAAAQGRPIMMTVSVVGTTELGGIDPVCEVQNLLDEREKSDGIHIWHHADAAYGGFFRTLDLKESKALSQDSLKSLAAIPRVTSITLDPHKLGYVPYASGAFLTRTKRDYYFSTFDHAPYIDFDIAVDRGPFTLEGSRSAAGAAATWVTAKTMGLDAQGHGLLLERTARIRNALCDKLVASGVPIQIAPGCDTNILCFTCAKDGEHTSVSNSRTLEVFHDFSPHAAKAPFIVSKTALSWVSYEAYLDGWLGHWAGKRDTDEFVLIRMCLMNPFFGSVETDVDYARLFIESLSASLKRRG